MARRGHRSESAKCIAQGRIKRASIKIERCDRVRDLDPGREKRPIGCSSEFEFSVLPAYWIFRERLRSRGKRQTKAWHFAPIGKARQPILLLLLRPKTHQQFTGSGRIGNHDRAVAEMERIDIFLTTILARVSPDASRMQEPKMVVCLPAALATSSRLTVHPAMSRSRPATT